MNINEAGVSPRSVRYIFTPSSFAERMFYYPTRVGHYFCDRRYAFSCRSEIAMELRHRVGYMLLLIKSGELSITCDGEQRTASSREVVLFDCAKPYEYHALRDNLEFYWLLWCGGQSALFVGQLLETHGAHVFAASDAAQLQLLLTRLLSYGEAPQRVPEHTFSETIYSLLCSLAAPSAGLEDEFAAIITNAAAFMDAHFCEPLSVDAVASHVGLSASYFTRHFRLRTGYPPYEYLTLRRIHRAKELLISTKQTVKQIAFETGYRSEDNFIRNFKKKTGVSPSTFRNYPI